MSIKYNIEKAYREYGSLFNTSNALPDEEQEWYSMSCHGWAMGDAQDYADGIDCSVVD